jgi:hypothetical protein
LPIHYNRDMTHQKEIDIQFVNDLYLSAVNDGILYERAAMPAILELRRKIKRGQFDEKRAPRMFQLYFLDLAREQYSKNQRVVKQRMTQQEKDLFGKLVYEFFKEEIKNDK